MALLMYDMHVLSAGRSLTNVDAREQQSVCAGSHSYYFPRESLAGCIVYGH